MPGAIVGVVCRPDFGNPGLGADSDTLVESLGRVALHPRHSHTMRIRSQQIAKTEVAVLQAVRTDRSLVAVNTIININLKTRGKVQSEVKDLITCCSQERTLIPLSRCQPNAQLASYVLRRLNRRSQENRPPRRP